MSVLSPISASCVILLNIEFSFFNFFLNFGFVVFCAQGGVVLVFLLLCFLFYVYFLLVSHSTELDVFVIKG